ncbi:AHH domain-containing protein [Aurantiacibacter sp. D1-12]|nr:AHH domain-containing protein [Aurantiacibacter sp. D1-12]MDE1466838.1 AHH domain-containing protein [Aurantiacibacter sp. D1-12]
MRAGLPFRAVNRRGTPAHDAGMQRHHLLPRQIMKVRCFATMFDQIGRLAIGFEDFRANGLLLPSIAKSALRTGLPLHCGPHRQYNELVQERVGCIERRWACQCPSDASHARVEALMRLRLLQRALRKRLMQRENRSLFLNRKDPFRAGVDFAELDAMVEALWSATA